MTNENEGGGIKSCIKSTVGYGVVLFLAIAGFFYVIQDKLLYMPDMPYKYLEDNPKGYRSPKDRSMNFSPVILETSDKEELHGWYIA